VTPTAGRPDRIAVDWGTSRFRAYLMSAGAVLDRIQTDDGIARLRAGQHAGVLAEACRAWQAQHGPLPTLLVGMIGSRNGWAEAPYVDAPCGAAEIAAARIAVPGAAAVDVLPGVRCRDRHGGLDVMRGEEVLVLGAGVADGIVCLPGTHSKWVRVEAGRIAGFATFVTGELFGVLREHAFIARLAEEPEDPAGFAEGLAAAAREGGLTRRLFETRTRVLDGAMTAAAVRPFLSGLLIGAELLGAAELYDLSGPVRIVADGVLGKAYSSALAARGIPASRIEPERALVAGLAAVDAALKEPA
jgi:2-dehydro-3-deoxygalactonokinase